MVEQNASNIGLSHPRNSFQRQTALIQRYAHYAFAKIRSELFGDGVMANDVVTGDIDLIVAGECDTRREKEKTNSVVTQKAYRENERTRKQPSAVARPALAAEFASA